MNNYEFRTANEKSYESEYGNAKQVPGVPTFWDIAVHPLSDESCEGATYSRGFTGQYTENLSTHNGVDIAKASGCKISAIADGKVIMARFVNGGYGYKVEIDHGNNVYSWYYHGSGDFYIQEGDLVKSGQLIMYMGNTGFSHGTHLHFTLLIGGNTEGYEVNPEEVQYLGNLKEHKNIL